mmetsp:Transcript_13188/g.38884  ORF Transcript_13188/g.38884 Transcript_13188/m.38884 type:complete len:162 (-) Transcript_13188:32-517(-)
MRSTKTPRGSSWQRARLLDPTALRSRMHCTRGRCAHALRRMRCRRSHTPSSAPGMAYTLRTAAEFFTAAAAPGGFYGNSFSTFSAGVALHRKFARGSAAAAPRAAYAYDCQPALVRGMRSSELFRTVSAARCAAAAGGVAAARSTDAARGKGVRSGLSQGR